MPTWPKFHEYWQSKYRKARLDCQDRIEFNDCKDSRLDTECDPKIYGLVIREYFRLQGRVCIIYQTLEQVWPSYILLQPNHYLM